MPTADLTLDDLIQEGRTVHWYFPGRGLCEDYVTGDCVIDESMGPRELVDCPECLDWIHA